MRRRAQRTRNRRAVDAERDPETFGESTNRPVAAIAGLRDRPRSRTFPRREADMHRPVITPRFPMKFLPLLFVCASLPSWQTTGAAEYDLLIRNARIADGTGARLTRGSIAVKN